VRVLDLSGGVASWLLRIVYILFWAGALVWSVRYTFRHGTDFVNRPRLFNPISGRNRPAIANY